MILRKLSVTNFRQFWGDQHKIEFAQGLRGVTIIRGENGSGKTALLNALKWVFYGETDFESKSEHLLSEAERDKAVPGQVIPVSVSVEFENMDRLYTMERRISFSKKEDGTLLNGSPELTMSIRDEHGAFRFSDNPTVEMQRILPKKLHPYFFFHGEKMEALAKSGERDGMRNAIKAVMGIESVERGVRHLKSLHKQYRSEVAKYSSDRLVSIEKQIEAAEIQKEEYENKIAQIFKNLDGYNSELNEINRRIRDVAPVREFQLEREHANKEILRAKSSIDDLRIARRKYLNEFGFASFSKRLIEKTKSVLEASREKGMLPPNIRSQFIDDLISDEKCICGRPLAANSQEIGHIRQYQTVLSKGEIESISNEVSAAIKRLQFVRENELESKLGEFLVQENELFKEIHDMTAHRDEMTARIGNTDHDDINELEARRADIEKSKDEANQDLGGKKESLVAIDSNLRELTREFNILKEEEHHGSVASRKVDLVDEAVKTLEMFTSAATQKVRSELDQIVRDTFSGIIKKNYWASVDEEYALRIWKKVGKSVQEVVDKSTGESQVASLSFIGSIVNLAKKKEGADFFHGGSFPIVMDSPFGQLDEEYRQRIAEAIPTLANQVVVMVSPTQWKNQVENAVAGKVGRHYLLVYHTPDEAKPGANPRTTISGAEHEYTEITEVSND